MLVPGTNIITLLMLKCRVSCSKQGFIFGNKDKGGGKKSISLRETHGVWGFQAERLTTNNASIENIFPDLTGVIILFSFFSYII